MGISINIHPNLRHLTNEQDVVQVNGNTVGQCLEQLVDQFPGVKSGLFAKDGTLLDYVTVYVNDESAYPEELARSVHDSDELYIVMMIAGG
ncbi:MAG: MoaD/ThiS family protein [Dehalococcoidales bacterium]|nr:MAG: MoaD/ThiS family protein [Dehalococcoidales bacterium]